MGSILLTTLFFCFSVMLAVADPIYHGCYSSVPLSQVSSSEGLTALQCWDECVDLQNNASTSVQAMAGEACYCGAKLPVDDQKVNDEKCDLKCAEDSEETCGNSAGDVWSVYLTGTVDAEKVDTSNGLLTATTNTTSSGSGAIGNQTLSIGNKTDSTHTSSPSASETPGAAGILRTPLTIALAVPLVAAFVLG